MGIGKKILIVWFFIEHYKTKSTIEHCNIQTFIVFFSAGKKYGKFMFFFFTIDKLWL